MPLGAVIFDLDGVLTDTAEYHYLAWKQLADEEGLFFDRTLNEQLRGVSRRDSLRLILGQQQVTEERLQEMMSRKNSYYVAMLDQLSSADLLPGAAALLDELDAAGIPYGLASASRNAPNVVRRLGVADRFAIIADGHSVLRQKPAPDLFRYAAAQMEVVPSHCLVIEDAAAGIEAAQAAGMAALALGPVGRFEGLLTTTSRTAQRSSLVGLQIAELHHMMEEDETWIVVQDEFASTSQNHMETVFTCGNGYFASRGSFEEGYLGESAITFAHGIFDDIPIAFTGLVNLPNWLDTAITINGHPFRLDKGTICHFRRSLDLQRGVLCREVRWKAADGTTIDLTFERFISYTQQHIGALRVLATAVNKECTVELQTGINGHVANDNLLHWRLGEQGCQDHSVWLEATTRATKIKLGTVTQVHSSAETATCQACPGQPRLVTQATLSVGQTLHLDKLLSYTSSRDEVPEAENVIGRGYELLNGLTFDRLKAEHTAAWQKIWQDGDVIIEGDKEAQLALRFNLYQLHVAAPQKDERVSIGAKSLSGYGYFGHVFWDTEIFILPYFIHTRPQIARNMLMYRYHTLDGARRKAAANGFKGAQYAWESALTGDEMTPTWVPHFSDKTKLVRIWTGDIQIHISADIAYAIMQYWRVTNDDEFLRNYGAEIIADTARFWGSRAEREETESGHQYVFRDVIGPDEYHDHVDNNAFTNKMAQWHLQTAVEVLDWLENEAPEKAAALRTQLEIDESVLAHWQDIIAHVVVPHNPQTGLITQFEDFFKRKRVEPKFIAQADKSLQVILGIEGANEAQVLKQADVLMLLCLFRDDYDLQTWQTNWDTYMPITDHRYGSSLGPSFHAWAACEMNRPQEAYRHFMLAAQADLRNPRGNAGDGIHAASAGGVWQAAVFGFAGLRLTENAPMVTPRLPDKWKRLAFVIYQHGRRWRVDIGRDADGLTTALVMPQTNERAEPVPTRR